jgi:hypothetical protein
VRSWTRWIDLPHPIGDLVGEHLIASGPVRSRTLQDQDDKGSLAEALTEATPAGIVPVHHPDGRVGLDEGDGQAATRAWWGRSANPVDARRPGLS